MTIWQKFKALTLEKQAGIILAIVVPVIGASWHVYTYFTKQPSSSILSSGSDIFIGESAISGPNSTQIITTGAVTLRDSQDKKIIGALLAGQKDKEFRIWEQSQQIQALQETLQALRTQEDKPAVQDALALLAQGDTGQAEKIFQKVLDQKSAEGRKANLEAAAAARHLGSLAFLNDTDKALQAYRLATKLDPDNPSVWNMLGQLLFRIGDIDGAKKAYQATFEIGEDVGGQKFIAIAYSYGNLGNVYSLYGDLDKAVDMYNKSLELCQAMGLKECIASCYGNLGNIYMHRSNLDKAEEMFNKSLEIEQVLGFKEGMVNAYGSLGLPFTHKFAHTVNRNPKV